MPRAQGVLTECTRGLPELRDQAELHVKARPYGGVSVLRFEEVSANYTAAVTRLFGAVLPPLNLPRPPR